MACQRSSLAIGGRARRAAARATVAQHVGEQPLSAREARRLSQKLKLAPRSRRHCWGSDSDRLLSTSRGRTTSNENARFTVMIS